MLTVETILLDKKNLEGNMKQQRRTRLSIGSSILGRSWILSALAVGQVTRQKLFGPSSQRLVDFRQLGSQIRELRHCLFDLILKDLAAASHAEGLAKVTEEDYHCCRERYVRNASCSFKADSGGSNQNAYANPGDHGYTDQCDIGSVDV